MRIGWRVRCGFTLVELLVVLSIIAVLILLLLPAVQKSREAARRLTCSVHLKQLGIAMHNYHDTFNLFPPAGWATGNKLSWIPALLPYIEQTTLYDKVDFQANDTSSAEPTYADNALVASQPMAVFLCPSCCRIQSQGAHVSEYFAHPVTGAQMHAYTTHYYGILGPKGEIPQFGGTIPSPAPTYKTEGPSGFGDFSLEGIMGRHRCHALEEISDGASNTFLLGELSWDNAAVYRTIVRGCLANTSGSAKNVHNAMNQVKYNGSDNFNDVSFGSEHPGGCHFIMADGSVQFVSQSIDMDIYRASASRAGHEAKTISQP